MSNLGSGLTMDDCKALTMKLYCICAGRKDENVNNIFAPTFSYLDGAKYLSKHPKFCATRREEVSLVDIAVRRKRSHVSNNDDGSPASSDDDDVTGMDGRRRKKRKGIQAYNRKGKEEARDSEAAKEFKDM